MPLPSVAQTAGLTTGVAALAVVGLGGAAEAQASPAAVAPVPAVSPALPAQDTPVVVAHRGASGYAPENTLAAVDAAAERDTDWVEVDVQRTADGELVLVHDTTLERTTDAAEVFPDRAPWEVADFTAEEVAQLDAGSWYASEFAGEPVPTLADGLERLAENDQKLLLELKSPELYPGIEEEILAELDAAGWLDEEERGERLVLQSFEADSVRTVHELAPEVKTGFLGTPTAAEAEAYAEFSDQINPRHTDLTADYVAQLKALTGAHGEPIEVNTWTVNEPADAERVAGLGVDGIISDYPDVVREAIGG